MIQPKGYMKVENLVCNWTRIYMDLKQAARKSNEYFDSFLKEYKVNVNNANTCIYFNLGETKNILWAFTLMMAYLVF